ncbi:uncharacterized protein METZ01_LOCUS272634, partial [marine metagenome]
VVRNFVVCHGSGQFTLGSVSQYLRQSLSFLNQTKKIRPNRTNPLLVKAVLTLRPATLSLFAQFFEVSKSSKIV